MITILLISLIFITGCNLTEESVAEINKKIEDRYNTFSTMRYTVTILLYKDGLLVQKEERTELIKKPDKMKQIVISTVGAGNKSQFSVCNKNTLYSLITPDLMEVYEYVNLLPEMTTYCGYYVNKELENWEIPMSITDATKYKVETSKEVYNGKKAIKCIVTILMSDEAKQKQIAIGKTPRESVITYWFDADNLAILKEETHGFGSIGEVTTQIGGKNSTDNTVEFETKSEKIYDGFYFDLDIPDSEFEIHASDYPGVKFIEYIVDTQEKFK